MPAFTRYVAAIVSRLWAAFLTLLSIALVWLITAKIVASLTAALPAVMARDEVVRSALAELYRTSLEAGHGDALRLARWVFAGLSLWSAGRALRGHSRANYTPLVRAVAAGSVIVLAVVGSLGISLRTAARRLNVARELSLAKEAAESFRGYLSTPDGLDPRLFPGGAKPDAAGSLDRSRPAALLGRNLYRLPDP